MYAYNNPVMHVDPDGEVATALVRVVAKAIILTAAEGDWNAIWPDLAKKLIEYNFNVKKHSNICGIILGFTIKKGMGGAMLL